jgi:probable HAF family extracellular repeat protein
MLMSDRSIIVESVSSLLMVSAFVGNPSVIASPSIRNVGNLAGGITLAAEALNDEGVAVGQSLAPDGNFRAFASYPDGTVRDLGALGIFDSYARGINNSGVVVGDSGVEPNNQNHAFRYAGVGPMQDLGTLGGSISIAFDINDNGLVVGWSYTAGNLVPRAFRSFGPGSMQGLGALPGGGDSSASAVSDQGVIVGGARAIGNRFHIFRFAGDGPMEDLGMLEGSFGSTARDVNEAGVIAGAAFTSESSIFETHAIRCLPDGTITDLETLPGGYDSEGNAIHDNGLIAGSSNSFNGYQATLWLTDNTIVDLDAWLDVVNPTEGAKWTLTDAFDINVHGQVCGRGRYDDGPGGMFDGQTGFVLDASFFIPEPACPLVAVSMVGYALRRRARLRG